MYGSSDTARITSKIPGQLLWNPRCKTIVVSAPLYRKIQQLNKPDNPRDRMPRGS